MSSPLARGTPREQAKAQSNATSSERLLQVACDATAKQVGALTAGFQSLAGPQVTAHDVDLLLEIGEWLAGAAHRSGRSPILRALMVMTAAEDQNQTLLAALGIQRLPTGQPFVPETVTNAEENIRRTIQAMTDAFYNDSVLRFARMGVK